MITKSNDWLIITEALSKSNRSRVMGRRFTEGGSVVAVFSFKIRQDDLSSIRFVRVHALRVDPIITFSVGFSVSPSISFLVGIYNNQVTVLSLSWLVWCLCEIMQEMLQYRLSIQEESAVTCRTSHLSSAFDTSELSRLDRVRKRLISKAVGPLWARIHCLY